MKKWITLLFIFVFIFPIHADEGMWMLGQIDKKTQKLLYKLGLQVPFSKIYNPQAPSLTDAIVNFGGFCSGVVVSQDGLVFTNHHCGFEAIQQHSSIGQDYLKEGFVAHTYNEELPNPELYVSFLVRTENVTNRIFEHITPQMNESEKKLIIDSLSLKIQEEVSAEDSLLRGVVNAYYEGNEYYLSVYKDYNDVRLVFAPPSSIGKFGGDTDNWIWPRHTGDFAVFRIYAGKNNEPSSYSSENITYRPKYAAPISLNGYKEGGFCITLGYPGETERYLSSFGIKEKMETGNAAKTNIRSIKQHIWKKAMEQNDSVRIKYASKYARSANYWKNSIGMNQAIQKLKVIEKKQKLEQELRKWIQQDPDKRNSYLHILTNLELNYRNRFNALQAAAFFEESFFNAPELITIALTILNFDFTDEEANVKIKAKNILDQYQNLDIAIDKEVFISMLKAYPQYIAEEFWPETYNYIKKDYKGDYVKFADDLYTHSQLTTPKVFHELIKKGSSESILNDPAIMLSLDLLVKYYEITQSMDEAVQNIIVNERLLNSAIREMQSDRYFYPDANFTMRLSFGFIEGYEPQDAIKYKYHTTTNGILEKVWKYKGNPDFEVQPALLDLLSKKDFGAYANSTGEMNVCFITNNDITGGNSGSGMFNGEGELIGLAFDGNWEAMSSDIIYEPNLQRCIGVDIRYILFIIEKYGKASHLIKELGLKPVGTFRK